MRTCVKSTRPGDFARIEHELNGKKVFCTAPAPTASRAPPRPEGMRRRSTAAAQRPPRAARRLRRHPRLRHRRSAYHR